MLAHLLTPFVAHALLQAWQVTALSELRHELLAVLPFVESADLLDLPSAFLFLNVEEGGRIADLA